MWPNPQETANLVNFTAENFNGKLHFLCSAKINDKNPSTIEINSKKIFINNKWSTSYYCLFKQVTDWCNSLQGTINIFDEQNTCFNNLEKNIIEKFLKLGKIDFSMKCCRGNFITIFGAIVKIFVSDSHVGIGLWFHAF